MVTPPDNESGGTLSFLLETLQSERSQQLSHFEALDARASVIVGFAGLLMTLIPDVPKSRLLVSVAAAGVTSLFGLSSFWARSFPAIRPLPLRQVIGEDLQWVRAGVYDQVEAMLAEGSVVLARKATRLRIALVFLLITATSTGIGLATRTTNGSVDSANTPSGPTSSAATTRP